MHQTLFSCPIFTSFAFVCLTRLVAELISCNKCESFELVVVLISAGCNHDAWQQISPHASKSRLMPANLFTRCASTWVGEKKMGTFTLTGGYDSEQQESAPRFFPGAAKTTDASLGVLELQKFGV